MRERRIKALEAQVERWEELTRRTSTSPWKAAPGEDAGKDWLIASLGRSGVDGHDWLVTTEGVTASEMTGDARTDAEWIAEARRAIPILLKVARAFLAGKGGDDGDSGGAR